MNVGMTGAICEATSDGGCDVVTITAGTPFFRPSTTNRCIAVSLPMNGGPTNMTLEANGIPPRSRSSMRSMPVLTLFSAYSVSTASPISSISLTR